MAKITTTTQENIDIVDIKDNVVILKGGRFRIVLEATAINFDLLSESEQDAAIYSYANLVNSLDFPLQVVIRTRQVDIGNYLKFLENHGRSQPTSALKEQLNEYISFVRQLVVENTILFKKFYVVVPFWSLETQKQDVLEPITSLLPWVKRDDKTLQAYAKTSLADAKKVFERRQEELSWQFRRLGIKIKRVESAELISLFYEILNPEAAQNSDMVKKDASGFFAPFVQTATEK